MDVERVRRELARELRARARPAGIDLQAYVGSPYPVLGASVPDLRAIVRSFAADHKGLPVREVNRIAAALWSGPTFEEKALAALILERHKRILDDASWRLLDGWVERAIGWGLSDTLASGPIASMVCADPRRFREILRWTRSENIWRRRASTYALRGLVQARDFDRPFELLERLLYDEEFWVQRAVGTWLRECWKRDRRGTEAFLRAHVRGLPRVVITVATERAPKALRQELRRNRTKPRAARPDRPPRPPRRASKKRRRAR